MVQKMMALPPASSALGRLGGQAVNVHIARGDHRPRGGNPYDGLMKVRIGEAYGPQHGPAGCAVWAIDNDGGVVAGGMGVGHGCEKSAVVSRLLPPNKRVGSGH